MTKSRTEEMDLQEMKYISLLSVVMSTASVSV